MGNRFSWRVPSRYCATKPADPAGLLVVIQDITQRKLLEQDLRESEEEYRSMFELSSVGKARVDPETGRILRVNKKLCEITGYTREELLALAFVQLTYPADRDADRERYEGALKRETPGWISETRYARKDGAVIWVKVTGSVLFDGDGRPQVMLGHVEDVTEARHAAEALRESEERYRSLVESAPEAICVHQGGKCVYMNPAGLELMGAKHLDEVRGTHFLDVVLPAFREGVAAWVRCVEEQGLSSPSSEMKIARFTGQELDVEAMARLVLFDGRPAVQMIINNVTEGKTRELRLRLQATVLAQVNDAVVAVGREGQHHFLEPKRRTAL